MEQEIRNGLNGHVEVECPHCKKKFWHRLADIFKKAEEGAIAAAAEVVQPGVSR